MGGRDKPGHDDCFFSEPWLLTTDFWIQDKPGHDDVVSDNGNGLLTVTMGIAWNV